MSPIGGPFVAVRIGDMITVDVSRRSISVALTDVEIAARIKGYKPPPSNYPRGYHKTFAEQTGQANERRDFDFLQGAEGIPEPEIHGGN
jgi:dihydroxy-acid dehydratase